MNKFWIVVSVSALVAVVCALVVVGAGESFKLSARTFTWQVEDNAVKVIRSEETQSFALSKVAQRVIDRSLADCVDASSQGGESEMELKVEGESHPLNMSSGECRQITFMLLSETKSSF